MKHYKRSLSIGNDSKFDVVVVGSGPAGVHAAYPLVKAGLRVAIIDGGLDSKKKDKNLIDFSDASLTPNSHAYDLLKESSYVFNTTYKLLKIKSNVEIIQSLAKGGLSEAWHGISYFCSKKELETMGLPADEIKKEYHEIAKLIKLKFPGLDVQSESILKKSRVKNNYGFHVAQIPLAFPYTTISLLEQLKQFNNFTYISNQLVFKANEKGDNVEIQSFTIDKPKKIINKAKYLILAAGSINTTRILLRSLGLFNYKTSFLTKFHYLIACLNFASFFKKNNYKKSDLGQLAILGKETDHGFDNFFTQLYRFNPLVLSKVIKYLPLPKSIALPILSFFGPSIMIADIRFSSFPSKNKFSVLRKKSDGKDFLEISFYESEGETKSHRTEYNKIIKYLRSLGLFPLKTVEGHITAHYAGGVLMGDNNKLSVDIKGKLNKTNRIYVGDSSTWRFLPAKPPTLTIMANASRVGKNVLRNFWPK